MIVSFNSKSGHEKVYVTVDETGDLGSKSRFFVYGATTLKDAEAFANVAKQYVEEHSRILGVPAEIGFSKANEYRTEIINDLNPYIDQIYAVVVKKPRFMPRFRKRKLAERSLELLTDLVAIGNEEYYVTFIVDETSLIKNPRVVEIVEGNSLLKDREVECFPTKSIDSYELQGNDYIVGSIGHAFENETTEYMEDLSVKPRIKRVRLRR